MMQRAELTALAKQGRSTVHQSFTKTEVSVGFGGVAAAFLCGLALFGAAIFCNDVQEEVNELSQPAIELSSLSGECVKEAEGAQEKAPVAVEADIAAQDPQQFVECFALEEEEFLESAELADSYEA